jgi:hypothetical protein
MFTYTFEEENDIYFGRDFRYYTGIPNIPFLVSCTSGDHIELTAKGYGLREDYGSGSILVKIAHLPEAVKKVFRENFHLIYGTNYGPGTVDPVAEEVRKYCIVHKCTLFGPGYPLFWVKGMDTHELLFPEQFEKELNSRLEPYQAKRAWWQYRAEFHKRFSLPLILEDGTMIGAYTVADPYKETQEKMEILGI